MSPEPNAAARFSRRPVDKSSITATWCPSPTSRSTRLEPMKPAPPVTSPRIRVDLFEPNLAVLASLPGRLVDETTMGEGYATGSVHSRLPARQAAITRGGCVAAAADPTGPMTRPPGLRAAVRRRGWLLPYVTVPVVMIADVLLGPTVNLAAFLVLAPVLASRL